jgi:hypothetical protein
MFYCSFQEQGDSCATPVAARSENSHPIPHLQTVGVGEYVITFRRLFNL